MTNGSTAVGQLGGYYSGATGPEIRNISYLTTATSVVPYFSMSAGFTEKALSTGVIVPTNTPTGFRSSTGQFYGVNQQVLNTLTQTGGSNKTPDTQYPTPTSNGASIFPLLLIGGAILLLGGK